MGSGHKSTDPLKSQRSLPYTLNTDACIFAMYTQHRRLYLCHVHSTQTPVSLPCTSVSGDGYTVHSCPPPLSPGDTRGPLGDWCQMGVWCAGVGGGGTGAVSGRVLWCGGVCWGLSGRCWAGVGRSGAQPRAHRCGVERSPSTPRRAMLAAAASRLKSASTLARPRTRAWRPPCFRRTRCASLRSTLGRTAR